MKVSKNILWNAAGVVLPLFVGVLAVPRIVAGLGVERFGVLSVIWMIIGYFSIFDLGLGRTLTKLVADRLAGGDRTEIPQLVSTTLVIVCASGAILGGVTAACAHWIAQSALHASIGQQRDIAMSIIWLACSLPFVLVATALFGLLEAYQAFALISLIRLPVGVLAFLTPLAILPFSNHLSIITAALGAIRVVTALVLLFLSHRLLPDLRGHTLAFYRKLVRPLLTFGGWLTVSNVIGPVMTYFDRFLIAAVAGSAAIAYYTVPYDVVMRLLVFPTAIQAVLFPAFVTLRHQDSPRLRHVFGKSSEATLLLMIPALLGVLLFGQEGLRLWMGPLFARNSFLVAEILMVGVLLNAMARTPFAFVQSAGYANWTAMTHLIELPAYAAALWWLLKTYGISGAAYAWTGRVFIDTVVFYALAVKIEPKLLRISVRDLGLISMTCLPAVLLGRMIGSVFARGALLSLVALACGLALLWRVKDAFVTRVPAQESRHSAWIDP
jgi:O-antigen/teichoic acid export membrane protein